MKMRYEAHYSYLFICVFSLLWLLVNDALISLHYIYCRILFWLINNDYNRIWKQSIAAYVKVIRLDELWRVMKNRRQYNQFPGRN
jgi:hypothetical protein